MCTPHLVSQLIRLSVRLSCSLSVTHTEPRTHLYISNSSVHLYLSISLHLCISALCISASLLSACPDLAQFLRLFYCIAVEGWWCDDLFHLHTKPRRKRSQRRLLTQVLIDLFYCTMCISPSVSLSLPLSLFLSHNCVCLSPWRKKRDQTQPRAGELCSV